MIAAEIPKPNRSPDRTEVFDDFRPGVSLSHRELLEHWAPTATELGQERYTITGHPGHASTAASWTIAAEVDTIADAGMRETFREMGFETSHSVSTTEDQSVEIHELVLAYSSVNTIAQNARNRAATMTPGSRFTIRPTGPRRYDPVVWIAHGAGDELLMAREDPNRPPGKDDSWHDRIIHHLAMVCMPPLVTTGISRLMRQNLQEYKDIIALSASAYKDRQIDAFRRRAIHIADRLEIINTSAVRDLVTHSSGPTIYLFGLAVCLVFPVPRYAKQFWSIFKIPGQKIFWSQSLLNVIV